MRVERAFRHTSKVAVSVLRFNACFRCPWYTSAGKKAAEKIRKADFSRADKNKGLIGATEVVP